MKNQILDLQTYQLEIIHLVEEKKRKRMNLIKGYLLFILIDLAILIPIAYHYYTN